MRSRWGALLLLPVLLALMTGTASAATSVADVVASLRSDPVFVDPTYDGDVDADAVRAQIRRGQLPVYVALLPGRAADALGGHTQLNGAIGERLGRAVLFTVAGDRVTGGNSGGLGLQTGQTDAIAQRETRDGDLTQGLVRAVASVQQVAASAGSGGSGGSGGGSYNGGQDGTGAEGGGTVLAVLGLLGLGGVAYVFSRSRKRKRQAAKDMEGARADVESLYNRLGADVANLHPGDDAVARQALADAAERYNATGALLSSADTNGEFAAARRTVAEGIAAARLARQRLGLDLGPEVPPPPGQGPQLDRREAVRVGEQDYEGSPTYAPGRQHYWGGGMLGGAMVPGGWYAVPFWESMLVGSMIGGAWGGGFGGYGGGGYERGYEEGVEDAREDSAGRRGRGRRRLGRRRRGGFGGGGDWGGGGGGDWGGGGGDFGGGGGDGGSW